MIRLFSIVLALVLAAYALLLRRRLQAAQLRGDMYHDIALRLDQRLAGLTTPAAS